jgi:dihydrofolate reductase
VVHSLKQGLAACKGEKKVFLIGGEQLYRLGLSHADTLILTVLDREVEGDAFFPDFSCPPFKLVRTEKINHPVPYSIQTYQRLL